MVSRARKEVTTARDEMLAAVRAARPPRVSAPDVSAAVRTFAQPAGNEAIEFIAAARAASAVVLEVPRAGVASAVSELAHLDVFVCEAELGVAENGAVWVATPSAGARAALFLALHVVIVVDRGAIVPDLHAAYSRLSVGSVPFGVFVAGPSRTADIEQALVIGAHGPKALTILLVH
jgi:L-lactate dehydrogenase complex protein LldG